MTCPKENYCAERKLACYLTCEKRMAQLKRSNARFAVSGYDNYKLRKKSAWKLKKEIADARSGR